MEETLPEVQTEKPIRTRRGACTVCANGVVEQDGYTTDADGNLYHPRCYTKEIDQANNPVPKLV